MSGSAVVSKDDGNFINTKVRRCSQANSPREYIDIMIWIISQYHEVP